MIDTPPAPRHIARLGQIAIYLGNVSRQLAALGYAERSDLYRRIASRIEHDVASIGLPKADDAAPPATTKPQGWRQHLHPAMDRIERVFKSDWTPRVLYTLLLWTVTGGLIRALDGRLTATAGHPLLEYMAGTLSPTLLLFVIVAQALTFFLVGLFGLMYSQPTGRVSKEALIDGIRQYYTFGASAGSLAAWYGHWSSSLVFLFFGVVAPWTALAGNDTRKQN